MAGRCIWRKGQPGDCAIAPGRSCGRRREGSRPDAERGRLGVDLGGRIDPEPRERDGPEDRWCLYVEAKEKGVNARQPRAVNAHVSRGADSEIEEEMAMEIEKKKKKQKQKQKERQRERVRAGKLQKGRKERAQGARSNEREKRRRMQGRREDGDSWMCTRKCSSNSSSELWQMQDQNDAGLAKKRSGKKDTPGRALGTLLWSSRSRRSSLAVATCKCNARLITAKRGWRALVLFPSLFFLEPVTGTKSRARAQSLAGGRGI